MFFEQHLSFSMLQILKNWKFGPSYLSHPKIRIGSKALKQNCASYERRRSRGKNCKSMSQKEQVKLDDEQVAELREIFRSFDRNDDGSLTELELGSLLRSLGLKPSNDQIEEFIQKADKNNNGLVEFSEFVSLVAPELIPANRPYTEDQLKKLFQLFDRDGNGYITAAELAHSMAKLGHALTANELTGMIKEADSDGDGCINFQEFSQAITSAAFDSSWT